MSTKCSLLGWMNHLNISAMEKEGICEKVFSRDVFNKYFLLLFEVTVCFTKAEMHSIHANLVFQGLSWVFFFFSSPAVTLAVVGSSSTSVPFCLMASHCAPNKSIPLTWGGRKESVFYRTLSFTVFFLFLCSCNLRTWPHLHPTSENSNQL